MADTEKKDLERTKAQTEAKDAIDSGATKVVAKLQDDGKWTLIITKP